MARFIHFSDPEEFHARTQSYLEAHEVELCLTLGILQDLLKASPPGAAAPRMYTVESGSEILSLGIHNAPYPLNLACLEGESWKQIADAVQANPPGRLSAHIDLASAYAKHRVAQTGESVEVEKAFRMHCLREVRRLGSPVLGSIRKAGEQDSAQLRPWFYQYAVDCDLKERMAQGVPKVLPYPEAGGIFVWEVAGEVCSMAAITRESPEGKTISWVYTPDEFRGRGYASALVANLSQAVLDQGKRFCVLFTDLSNPTSNKIYAACGYEPVADFQVLAFE